MAASQALVGFGTGHKPMAYNQSVEQQILRQISDKLFGQAETTGSANEFWRIPTFNSPTDLAIGATTHVREDMGSGPVHLQLSLAVFFFRRVRLGDCNATTRQT